MSSAATRPPASPFESSPHWPYLAASAVLTTFAAERLNPIGKGGRDINRIAAMLIDYAEPVKAGPARGRWKLRDDIRRRVLATLATRDRIREAMEANARDDWHDPTERALQELVSGTVSPRLTGRSLEELLGLDRAVEWLQVAKVDPLPAREDIQARIQREKLLEPLRRLVIGFEGRAEELRTLRSYVDTLPSETVRESVSRFSMRVLNFVFRANPPLFIHGPGGSGKSTLVAKFILDHAAADAAEPMPFVLLDFDRSTLDPARPDSLVAEAIAQLTVQFPRHATDLGRLQDLVDGRLMGEDRAPTAQSAHYLESRELRYGLADVINDIASQSRQNFLLVVDTFEIVQRRGPTAVFSVLELVVRLLSRVHRLRVVLIGRSALRKEDFESFAEHELPSCRDLPLRGFDQAAGRAYLRARLKSEQIAGVGDEDLDRVVFRVRGNPLGLRLAARVYAREGVAGVEDAVERILLDEAIAEEQLQSILHDRLVSQLDDNVRKIANPGLIVRRITPGVIRKVLAGPCGLDLTHVSEDAIFRTLRQEGSLVETLDNETLRHRPDVRLIMLPALRRDLGKVAREIDAAAVRFWRDSSAPAERAEEIYHRLWYGDRSRELEDRWLPEAGTFLEDALDEFQTVAPSDWARVWLAEKLGRELPDELRRRVTQQEWERDVEKKVRTLLADGRIDEVLHVVNERPWESRVPGSILWQFEIDALLLKARIPDAAVAIERALERLGDTRNAGFTLEVLARKVSLEERTRQPVEARRTAERALALARLGRDPAAVFATGVRLLRLGRKTGNDTTPDILQLRTELIALSRTQPVGAALGDRPSVLREAAAEIGLDASHLLVRALERLGLDKQDVPPDLPEGVGPVLEAATRARDMALIVANTIRTSEAPRVILQGLAQSYARSVERLLNQLLQ